MNNYYKNEFDDSSLIFIVSQPRSGSTMLQAILSNNIYINTSSESWLLLPYLYPLINKNKGKEDYNDSLAWEAISEYLDKIGGKESLTTNLKHFLLNLYNPLLQKDNKYIIDKTPRYYEILPIITEVFPSAKIIILKRNPIAVLESIIRTWKIKTIQELLDKKHDILTAPYKIQKFIDHNNDNKNVLIIKYEDLILQAEKTFNHVFKWLSLDFKKNYLDFSENFKIHGAFGDPTGIKHYKKPKQILRNKNFRLFFKNIIKGYKVFLGHEFMEKYGYPIYTSDRLNYQFKYFLFLSRNVNYLNFFFFIKRNFLMIRFFYVEEGFLSLIRKLFKGTKFFELLKRKFLSL